MNRISINETKQLVQKLFKKYENPSLNSSYFVQGVLVMDEPWPSGDDKLATGLIPTYTYTIGRETEIKTEECTE